MGFTQGKEPPDGPGEFHTPEEDVEIMHGLREGVMVDGCGYGDPDLVETMVEDKRAGRDNWPFWIGEDDALDPVPIDLNTLD